jgi:hypothetical protein
VLGPSLANYFNGLIGDPGWSARVKSHQRVRVANHSNGVQKKPASSFHGDAMRAAKNRGFGHERYLKLRYWLLTSPAWQNLPGLSRALYLDIAMRYNGSNNGRISYSVREGAAALGVTKDTIGRVKERRFVQFPRLDGDDTGRFARVDCAIARTERTQAAQFAA